MYGIEANIGTGRDDPGDSPELMDLSCRCSLGDGDRGCGGGIPHTAMSGSKCKTYSGGRSIHDCKCTR